MGGRCSFQKALSCFGPSTRQISSTICKEWQSTSWTSLQREAFSSTLVRVRQKLLSTYEAHPLPHYAERFFMTLIPTTTQGAIALRVAPQYTHLGGVLHGKATMKAELRKRVVMGHAAFEKHRKVVYQQVALPLADRVTFFEACILSVVYYNSGTWTTIHPHEWKTFERGVISLYKRLIAKDVDHEVLRHMTNDDVCNYVGLPSPGELLRLARLRYYGTAILNGPDALWGLIAAESLWHDCVREDLTWLHDLTVGRHHRPSPAEDPDHWQQLALFSPGKWKGLIKKARLHLMAIRLRRQHVYNWHIDCQTYLDKLGLWRPLLSLSPTQPMDQKAEIFPCYACQKIFNGKAAWAVHSFKKHGYKAYHRHLAHGRTCDACGRSYQSAHRFSLHLQYSQKCAVELQSRGVWVAPLPGRGSRQWQQEEQDDRCPWMPTQGPRLPLRMGILDLSQQQQDFAEQLFALEEELIETYEADAPDVQEQWTQKLVDVCSGSILGFEGTLHTIQVFQQHFEEIAEQTEAAEAFLQTLTNILALAEPNTFLRGDVQEDHSMQGKLTEEFLKQLPLDELRSYIPAPALLTRFQETVFVHLYSGRTRPGDLQEQLESLTWEGQLPPIVVSLDMMVDASQCNMMVPHHRATWLDHALAGRIAGGLGGPPCETFSSARFNDLMDSPQAPRPVRTLADLWGKEGLTLREERQVHAANVLLTFSLLLQLVLWGQGRWYVNEHPKEPDNPSYPSIWRMPITNFLESLPELSRVLVWQGLYGGHSPKPTHLLVAHGAADLKRLAPQYQCSAMPRALRMGREDGSHYYTTAKLKEYPSGFCRLLAAAFQCWTLRAPLSSCAPRLSRKDHAIFEKLKVTFETSAAFFGPDFAGWMNLFCKYRLRRKTSSFEKRKKKYIYIYIYLSLVRKSDEKSGRTSLCQTSLCQEALAHAEKVHPLPVSQVTSSQHGWAHGCGLQASLMYHGVDSKGRNTGAKPQVLSSFVDAKCFLAA